MTADEADACGVDKADRHLYFRVDPAKGNYAPKTGKPRWFKMQSVSLMNGQPDTSGHAAFADGVLEGDSVGVPVLFTPSDKNASKARAEFTQRNNVLGCVIAAMSADEMPLVDILPAVMKQFDRQQRAAHQLVSDMLIENEPVKFGKWTLTPSKKGTSKTSPTIITRTPVEE